MVTKAKTCIIPTLRYRNAPGAIAFLCAAFGFERHAVHEGPGNTIAHAQLTLGSGMVMLSSASDVGEFDQWVQPPASPTSVATQGIYIVVADCDAHFVRAKSGGTTILRAPRDEDYGGRGYTCRDPEGHVWSFGTCDPWLQEG